jgi:hypothetical protein
VLALLLTLQTVDELAKTAEADEKLYPMTRVVERLQKKLADDDVEDYVGKSEAAAMRRVLEDLNAALAEGLNPSEAAEKAIGSPPAAHVRVLVKSRDLKLLADQQLRVLKFRNEFIHNDRDRAKSRQQQRAIGAAKALLWPEKKR